MSSIVGVMQKVAAQEVERIFTTELGIVTAIFPHASEDDTDNYQCSVKLKNYKTPEGDDYELRKVPVATAHMGMACIPNINDLVLLNFISGDINAPVIVGRLYNDEDRPPLNNESEVLVQHNVLEGGKIKIDAEGTITMTSKSEANVVTVSDDKISAEGENYQIIIDTAGDKISILATQDIEITSSEANISLNASTIDLTATGAFTIQGATVNINKSE